MFLGGIFVSILIAALGWIRHSPLQPLEGAMLDGEMLLFASGTRASHVVVVDIDDVSLSALGQWPWPRYRIASLVREISEQKPATIALDILFPEADRSSLANIQETYKRDFGIDVSFGGVPSGMLDNDGFLGQEIARAEVVGSMFFYFDHLNAVSAPSRPGIGVAGATDLPEVPDAPGVMMNAEAISSQTRSSGFLNTAPDRDGVLRRLPMLIVHRGVVHASLSLAALMHALGQSTATVESGLAGPQIRVANHHIPIDASGAALLRFDGGAASYASISAVDVLNGKVSAADLAGKIVFIGSSAVGLNDYHRTAMDPRFPGLKIQAVMTEGILEDRLVATPPWGRAVAFVACVLVGTVLSALFVAGSNVLGFVAASLLTAAAIFLAQASLFASARILVPLGSPLVVVATLSLMYFVARTMLEKRRAALWRRKLDNARQVTIESMASVAETRDPETGAHIKRTQNYVRAIAEELQRSGEYLDVLTKEFIELLFVSAPLHDIGKVGVPDHILLKPGKLTVTEMETMKMHAEFGGKIIRSTSTHIDGDNFLAIAGEIAATHHEKWNGSGYPHGLAGNDIPLSGRIMAVADIYDALISRRCYKEPFTHAHSTSLMREMRGTTFDPAVLDAFFRVEREILRIASNFKDEESTACATPQRVLVAVSASVALSGRPQAGMDCGPSLTARSPSV